MNVSTSAFVLTVACASLLAACSTTTRVEDVDARDAGTGGSAGVTTGGSSGSGGAPGSGGSVARDGGAGMGGGVSGSSGAGGSSGSGGAAGDAGSAGAGGCPSLPGPRLVPVDGFCIDSTEVTGQQYEAFVDAKQGDTSGQIAACSGNTSYVPARSWPLPTEYLAKPISYVDWCDAHAYCTWAGKRLCGAIGGGSSPYDAYADAASNQWHRVCTNGGRDAFPYGNTFDETACNGCNGFCDFWDVGSVSACQNLGDYAGIYDMSGNALEWEDSCRVDPATLVDVCRARGGSIYAQGETDMWCQADVWNERLDNTAPGIGFRCCYR